MDLTENLSAFLVAVNGGSEIFNSGNLEGIAKKDRKNTMITRLLGRITMPVHAQDLHTYLNSLNSDKPLQDVVYNMVVRKIAKFMINKETENLNSWQCAIPERMRPQIELLAEAYNMGLKCRADKSTPGRGNNQKKAVSDSPSVG